MDAAKFGSFLQTARKELGMTQTQLGEKLGVTDKAISRWERGVGFPDISLLEPLAEALGITVTELMRSERMERQELVPAGTAEEILKQTLDLAEEQRRHLWRGRLLTFGLIPLVLVIDVFLSAVLDQYVQGPEWLRVLSIGLVSWCVVFGVMGIRYIACCRYAGAVRRLPAMFWIATALTCLGIAVVAIALYIPNPKPRWLSLLVLLSCMLVLASPFYLYYLITNEIRDWNRWAGGRDF